ncbi:isocitrate dehydrogenase [NADP]-like [Rutidosis leptorrhynchoides]|uniref:isocitrate dehydrogenase [NADP]-like n=1 Tax=Rutidosis leptorrhynchoides TaxID=125765 RepID=UPI003A9907EC
MVNRSKFCLHLAKWYYFSQSVNVSSIVPEGEGEKIDLEVYNLAGAGGVALSLYNTDESITAFAEPSMNRAYQKKWPLYLSTKNTILKKYDGRFKYIFQEVYESNWQSKFEAAAICTRSLGLMTSVLVSPQKKNVLIIQFILFARTFNFFWFYNGIASILAWTRGLAHRAMLDNNSKLLEFTEKLEAACIGTIESGKMTKDLALIIHGSKMSREHYLNTEEFIDAVANELKARVVGKSALYVSS